MELTEEQRKLIEEKRQHALKLREAKKQERLKETATDLKTTTSPVVSSSGSAGFGSAGSQTFHQPTNISVKPNGNSDISKYFIKGGSSGASKVSNEKDKMNRVAPYTKPSADKIIDAKFVFRNKERISLFMKYDKDVVGAIKQIRSAVFDQTNASWHFHINDYPNLMGALKDLQKKGFVLKLENPIPQKVIATLKSYSNIVTSVNLEERLKPHMLDKLYEFQKEGIRFGISREGRVLIADDMGLGKTVQALGLACWYRSDWPLLVICPSSLRYQWRKSILTWIEDISDDEVTIVTESKNGFPETPVVICSYDMIARFGQIVEKVQVNFVICDESHYIKNDTAQRTKATLAFAKKAKRLVLLSGTPAMSRPFELFTQVSAVNGKIFPNKHEFGIRYCDGRKIPNRKFNYDIYNFRGSSNAEELSLLLEATIMIRRMKHDVLKELPAKRRMVVVLKANLSANDKRDMEAFSTQITMLPSRAQNKALYKTVLFDWYTKTAELKRKPVCEYVENLVNQDKKFICFAHHKTMMDALSELLESKNCPHIRIDGGTSGAMRQECCDYFQEKEECKVALISILAAGVGLNLTAAQLVIFAELCWNPGMLTQAEDRAHRIGQQDSVLIQYLNAPNTADDVIWPMITKKLRVLNEVGLARDNFRDAGITDSTQHLIDEFFPKIDMSQVPE